MSGWIKLEKDRRDDPRVLRMARELRNAGVTHERFAPAMHVTLVLGCLDVLWCYADTHVREDDTLNLGVDEIDELVGLKGFCNLMPPDWLEVLDAESVKLPDFHTHNGTESKKKALNQKRQERHRNADALKHETQASRTSVTSALPDQTKTRPDQDQEEDNSTAARSRVPSRHIDLVFAHWQKVHEHPEAKLNEKRRRLIAARLRDDYTIEQLRCCIDGYALSPFHNGENENGTVYDSLELMLRDAKHVEQGIAFHANPPKPNGTGPPKALTRYEQIAEIQRRDLENAHG